MIDAVTYFSGIGAAEESMKKWNWKYCAEFDPARPLAARILHHHRPHVPNLGDVLSDGFMDASRAHGSIDVGVAGPPCQSFSIAGLMKGLVDPRGALSIWWARHHHARNIKISITENVVNWLSVDDGKSFGAFVAEMVGHSSPLEFPGGPWPNAGVADGPKASIAWRITDAEFFGVPQSRRRVFVVSVTSGLGLRHPAELLFEFESLSWISPTRGKTWGQIASDGTRGVDGCCPEIAPTAVAHWAKGGHGGVGTTEYQNLIVEMADEHNPIRIRRFVPLEVERIMAFPDGYTAIPGASASARIHALGNAIPPPQIGWILDRVDRLSGL